MFRLKRIFATILLAGVLSLSGSLAFADGPGETPGKDSRCTNPEITLCTQDPPKDEEGPGETPGRVMFQIYQLLATFVA
jgi:hypothetical protein